MGEIAVGAGAPEELQRIEAPRSFRDAIVRDPSAGVHRLDQDALRGETPIDVSLLPTGNDTVPKDGYYLDMDGNVIDWYWEGNQFPKYGAVAGAGGRYYYLTGRRSIGTTDLLYIALRAGYPGNVKSIKVR